MPGSSFKAVYHKPANQPQLVAKQIPSGTQEFRARAWWETEGAIDGVDSVLGLPHWDVSIGPGKGDSRMP